MNNHKLLALAVTTLAASAAFAGPVRYQAETAISWTADFQVGTAMNNLGQVVGYTKVAANSVPQGFFWKGTTFATIPLKVPTTTTNIIAQSINDAGVVVGQGDRLTVQGYKPIAMSWTDVNQECTLVSPFDGFTSGSSMLLAVNNSGTAVGSANGWKVNNVNTTTMQALTYGTLNGLSFNAKNPTGASTGTAVLLGLNDSGVMVGYGTDLTGKKRGVRMTGGTMVTPVDPAGATNGVEYVDINAGGLIAGNFGASTTQTKAFTRTQSGTITNIPNYAGGLTTDSIVAKAINATGSVVGQVRSGSTDQAFLYHQGQTYKLSNIATNLPNFSFRDAVDINDRMQILVNCYVNGYDRIVRLNPLQTLSGIATMPGLMGLPFGRYITVKTYDADGNNIDTEYPLMGVNASWLSNVEAQGAVQVVTKPQGYLSKLDTVNLNPFDSVVMDRTYVGGDIDGDDEVSILDYLELSRNYEKNTSSPDWNYSSYLSPAKYSDIDADGEISILDYIILSTNYGQVGEGKDLLFN